MPKKKKLTLSQAADEITEIAIRHLQQFPEEEQERRISAAERRIANASRVDNRRTSSSSSRIRRTQVSGRGR